MKNSWECEPVQLDGVRFLSSVFDRTLIKKVIERLWAFIVGNYSIWRYYVHGENIFVLAREIEIAEYFKCVVAVFDVWR